MKAVQAPNAVEALRALVDAREQTHGKQGLQRALDKRIDALVRELAED